MNSMNPLAVLLGYRDHYRALAQGTNLPANTSRADLYNIADQFDNAATVVHELQEGTQRTLPGGTLDEHVEAMAEGRVSAYIVAWEDEDGDLGYELGASTSVAHGLGIVAMTQAALLEEE